MDPDGGGGGVYILVAGLAIFAAVAIGVGLVLDKAADYKEAAASQAYAHAAQVNAQANLVDARTAQIGMVAVATTPVLYGIIGLLILFAVVMGVLVFINMRKQRELQQYLPYLHTQSQLAHDLTGDPFLEGQKVVYARRREEVSPHSVRIVYSQQRTEYGDEQTAV